MKVGVGMKNTSRVNNRLDKLQNVGNSSDVDTVCCYDYSILLLCH